MLLYPLKHQISAGITGSPQELDQCANAQGRHSIPKKCRDLWTALAARVGCRSGVLHGAPTVQSLDCRSSNFTPLGCRSSSWARMSTLAGSPRLGSADSAVSKEAHFMSSSVGRSLSAAFSLRLRCSDGLGCWSDAFKRLRRAPSKRLAAGDVFAWTLA